jgi:hypothetical protein
MIFLFILLGALFVFSFCTGMFYMLCLSWILTFMKTDIPVLKRGLMYTGGKLKDELLDEYWKRAFVWLAVSVVLLFFSIFSFENNPISSLPTS